MSGNRCDPPVLAGISGRRRKLPLPIRLVLQFVILVSLVGCGLKGGDSSDSDSPQADGESAGDRGDTLVDPKNETVDRLKRIEAELSRDGHLHSICHEALELVDQALKEDPDLAVAYSVRGAVHKDHREWKKAIDDYDKAFDLDRSNVVYGRTLAVCYEADGQLDKALAVWKNLCRRFPDDGQNFFGRATIYQLLGRDEEAQADYERAHRL